MIYWSDADLTILVNVFDFSRFKLGFIKKKKIKQTMGDIVVFCGVMISLWECM